MGRPAHLEQPQNGSGDPHTIPIAVVGMGWRGPGDANSIESFYKMLAQAREARVAAHEGKWNHDAFYHPDSTRKGTSNVQAGHYFKDDLSLFDAPFFSMTDTEAACLDPQQRLLLETCYEALENAGFPLHEVAGSKTSVFVGTFGADYTDLLHRDPDSMPIYQATNSGNSRAIISNRLSHFFDFRGPSVTIDTACSGGLTAFHLACQSIRTGDARQAICGGSSVILHPDQFISLSAMSFLSPDGRCYSFDERANGYARGEGVGCVVLKRLDDAVNSGDAIRAIVRMTGSNQDGHTPTISYPSREAQGSLIKSVYQRAGLDPLQTTYVEAHGTGTQAGDPIETSAISETMCAGRDQEKPLIVGSVKANIGHLEAASGIAALIKCVLMLENKVIFPNRNFVKPNPRIKLKEWNLKIPTVLQSWESTGTRRLSINSFGYGGTNAHAILDSAEDFLFMQTRPTRALLPADMLQVDEKSHKTATNGLSQPGASGDGHSWRVFTLSAFDEASVKRTARHLAGYLRSRLSHVDDSYLADLAYTLNSRRSSLRYKTSLVANSAATLAKNLKADSLPVVKTTSQQPTLAFVFTGQGAQWPAMGKELLEAYPVYKSVLELCTSHLKSIGAAWDLIEELTNDAATSRISGAMFSQPICTAIQIALVELLASWGIRPQAVTGHSSGELAAAYAAGFISFRDAMTSAYHRGVFSHRVGTESITKGAMMAVGMGADEMQDHLSCLTMGYATVACENSPSSVTISGDSAAIDEMLANMNKKGVFARKLLVDAAYHSRHMAAVEKDYLDSITGMETTPGNGIEFFSSVTGKRGSHGDCGPSYWVSNMVGRVRFASSLRQLCHAGAGVDVLIELGPHSALAGPIKQIIQADEKLKSSGIQYMSALTRKKDAIETALSLAAKLAAAGRSVDLSAVNGTTEKNKLVVDLPAYSWNKSKSYWAEGRISKAYRNRSHGRVDLLGAPETNFNPLDARWRNIIRGSEMPWIKDHRIQSSVVYPAAGYVAMAIEAIRQLSLAKAITPTGYTFRDISIGQALVISNETDEIETAISLRWQSEGTHVSSDLWYEFFVYSVTSEDEWTEHCRGLVAIEKDQKSSDLAQSDVERGFGDPNASDMLTDMRHTCTSEVDIGKFYENLRDIGLDYGPSFANMNSARCSGSGECVASITLPDIASIMPGAFQHPFVMHPAVLDSALHSIFAALGAGSGDQLQDPMVPVFIEGLYVSAEMPTRPGHQLQLCTSVQALGARQVQASISVFDESTSGEISAPVISLTSLRCTRLSNYSHPGAERQGSKSVAYEFRWQVDPEMPRRLTDASGQLVNGDAKDSVPKEDLSSNSENHQTSMFSVKETDLTNGLPVNDIFGDILEASPQIEQQFTAMANHLGFHSHKNPRLKILEVGAGVGYQTLQMLEGIGTVDGNTRRCAGYDLGVQTGKSDDKLKQRLSAVNDLIRFVNWDAEDEIDDKDTMIGSYDVVLGIYLSVDAGDIGVAVRRLWRLLKPGGTLHLLNPDDANVVGTADSDAASARGSLLSPRNWDTLLQGVGFIVEHKAQHSPIVCRRPLPTELGQLPKPHILVITGSDVANHGLSHILVTELRDAGLVVDSSDMANADAAGKVCLILWDENMADVLAHPSNVQFQTLREILLRSSGAVSVLQDTSSNPIMNMVTGLSRTLRSEMSNLPFLTLNVEGGSGSARTTCDVLMTLVSRHFLTDHSVTASAADPLDTEYMLNDGQLMLPRLVPHEQVNASFATAMGHATVEDAPFIQEGRPLRVEIGTPGLLDTLCFTDDERMKGKLTSNQVEIEVRAVGFNFRDVMMAMGQIAVEALGGEYSGVVTAVGEAARDLFAVGDRVSGIHLGTFCTHIRTDGCLVQKMPDNMAFEVGASLPVVYCTAFHAVFEVARLRAGESVLIHAASGGLGQALIQMCQRVGAKVFVTVGSKEKRALLMQRFNIPNDHVMSSRDTKFAGIIMQMTRQRGVDVVMNSLAGEALRMSFSCVAPFGRFVELGKRDFFVNTRLDMARFAKNVTFAALDLVDLVKERPDVVATLWEQSMQLLCSGAVEAPWPITVYPMADLKTGLQMMQSGRHMGKLVAVPRHDDVVKVLPAPAKKELFKGDASYFLAGGLGGLGRAMGRWMIQNGARHLFLCSRSGAASSQAKYTMKALEDDGALVKVLACDITDKGELQSLLDDSLKSMPPIRGVIQSAMVLRDTMYENMTVDDWNAVVRPKVQGTLNLHTLFSGLSDLDFFVMLSSISGVIGNASQAAYAAANTFMDALASSRNRFGLPAVALDLGVISEVGHVAENELLSAAMSRQGFAGTTERELMALLRCAISNPFQGQIITGIGTWSAETSLGNFSAPLFSHFRRMAQGVSGSELQDDAGNGPGLQAELKRAKDISEATAIISMALVGQVSILGMVPEASIDTARPMSEYGIDSLVAVEMRNWIFREMDHAVPILELISNQPIKTLVTNIAGHSRLIAASIKKGE